MQCSALFLLKQIRRSCEIQECLFWRASDRYLGGIFMFCLMTFWETKPELTISLSFSLRVEFIQIPVVIIVLKVLTKHRQQGLNHWTSCWGQDWGKILKNWPGNIFWFEWHLPFSSQFVKEIFVSLMLSFLRSSCQIVWWLRWTNWRFFGLFKNLLDITCKSFNFSISLSSGYSLPISREGKR